MRLRSLRNSYGAIVWGPLLVRMADFHIGIAWGGIETRDTYWSDYRRWVCVYWNWPRLRHITFGLETRGFRNAPQANKT